MKTYIVATNFESEYRETLCPDLVFAEFLFDKIQRNANKMLDLNNAKCGVVFLTESEYDKENKCDYSVVLKRTILKHS